MKYLLAACVMALATGANGQPRTVEIEGEGRFLRCTDSFGSAECEILFPETQEAYYQCIAFDDAGDPIAIAAGSASGTAIFRDLDASIIEDVVCREL